jgi:hypothetical protein
MTVCLLYRWGFSNIALLLTLLLSSLLLACGYHDSREAPRAEKGYWIFIYGILKRGAPYPFQGNGVLLESVCQSAGVQIRRPTGIERLRSGSRNLERNFHHGRSAARDRYATYRLTIILPEDEKNLGHPHQDSINRLQVLYQRKRGLFLRYSWQEHLRIETAFLFQFLACVHAAGKK